MFDLKKLLNIQQKLKVPKSQHNEYGDFDFRNLDDIIAAVKPMLKEENLLLVFDDLLKEVGGKNYIGSTAILYDAETGEKFYCTAFAREADTQKGMQDAQLSGSTSSYARKYAANALFALDDTQNIDSMDNSDKRPTASDKKAVDTNTKAPTENQPQADFVEIKGDACLVKTKQGMVDIKRLNIEQLNIIYNNPNYKKAQPYINGLLDAKG